MRLLWAADALKLLESSDYRLVGQVAGRRGSVLPLRYALEADIACPGGFPAGEGPRRLVKPERFVPPDRMASRSWTSSRGDQSLVAHPDH